VTASWGNADDIAEGESVAYAFDNPGVYPYFCILHPGMVGAIVVGDGVPVGEAAHITAGAASDDDGWSTALTAGIFAAIGFGGAALGMVGTRLVWRKS
jgi:hypothetical protein